MKAILSRSHSGRTSALRLTLHQVVEILDADEAGRAGHALPASRLRAAGGQSWSSRSRGLCRPSPRSVTAAPSVSAIGVGTHRVQLIEVDVIGAPGSASCPPRQLPDVCGFRSRTLFVELHAELGGQHDLAAARVQSAAAEELLNLATAAIDVGGVEKIDAYGIDRGVRPRPADMRRRCASRSYCIPVLRLLTSSDPILLFSNSVILL